MNTEKMSGRRAAVIVGAVAGAVAVRGVARAAGVDLVVRSGPDTRPVGLASVLVVSLVAGLAAAGGVHLVARSGRPRPTWFAVSATTLLLSLAGPLGAATAGAGVALLFMHAVVGVILITGMGVSLPVRRPDVSEPATAQERLVR